MPATRRARRSTSARVDTDDDDGEGAWPGAADADGDGDGDGEFHDEEQQHFENAVIASGSFHGMRRTSRNTSVSNSVAAAATAASSPEHGALQKPKIKVSLRRATRNASGGAGGEDGYAGAPHTAASEAAEAEYENGYSVPAEGDEEAAAAVAAAGGQEQDSSQGVTNGATTRRSLRSNATKSAVQKDHADGTFEDEDLDAPGEPFEEEDLDEIIPQARTTRSGRHTKRPSIFGNNVTFSDEDDDDEDEDSDEKPRKSGRTSRSRSKGAGARNRGLGDFVEQDDADDVDDDATYGSSRRRARGSNNNGSARGKAAERVAALAKKRRANIKGKNARYAARRRASSLADDDGDFEMDNDEAEDTPEDGTSLDLPEDDEDEEEEEEEGGTQQSQGMRLRARKEVNYALPAPPPVHAGCSPRGKKGGPPSGSWGVANGTLGGGNGGRSSRGGGSVIGAGTGLGSGRAAPVRRHGYGRGRKTGWDALPASMSGKDLAALFGEADEDSDDSDVPKQKAGGRGGLTATGMLTGGLQPAPTSKSGLTGDLTGTGATDTMGKLKSGGDPLADIDPLGTDMQIDFNAVGGLDAHIEQLKEMVTLPLLYPELFQRFKITPPRGVLFHGPPGTGKTLVARALAASCSSEGQRISFFMRKGADVLSKWVGEAERQLRLLFEEAKNAQPSIIFFDEIDGLAPVRSSKQDQIHASIVSTLLALMDGMDGRGQVVVIGATNRPDSVDPALRRPGRFDREFYFPLPSKDARRKILDIHTSKWDPPLHPEFKDRLAELTKGYGGADMRALCTEAALNAIQRRYPQIYQTTDRLLLKPESVTVEAKDFMMSINKIVPSSARSASSAAAPLPNHLKPLLSQITQQACAALDKILPETSKRTALEEALWEDAPAAREQASTSTDVESAATGPATISDYGFGREMLLQSFQNMRVFRPRLLVHGRNGMGQRIVGAAMLQHLEGYHVQSIDVATLMGDSTRTPEASAIQLFTEAKRHKPSVLFIPGLAHWAKTVSESVRSTVKALLDGLSPSDPVLLLGISEAPLSQLPRDVRSWFGLLRENRIEITRPSCKQREEFFREVIEHVSRRPTDFPDAVPRRKKVLEKLPIAPPRPPREPTAAELQQQAENDARLLEHLKYRLGPVLNELRKKYKVFTKDVWDEYNFQYLTDNFKHWKGKGSWIFMLPYERTEEQIEELRRARAAAAATAAEVAIAPEEPAAREGPTVNGHADPNEVQAGAANNSGAVDVSMRGPEPADVGKVEPDAAGPAPEEEEEDLRISWENTTLWTMSLEKMQKKLYYDAYYCVSDFLDDLQKVVHNAEAAESVDAERAVKARQMGNLAHIMLDQFVDPAFRAECELMAVRNKAREEDARKAAENVNGHKRREARRLSGPVVQERHSARQAGEQPQHRYPVDVTKIEREANLERKRTRDSGSDCSRSHDSTRGQKRAKTSDAKRDAVAPGTLAPCVPPVLPFEAASALEPTVVAGASARVDNQAPMTPSAAELLMDINQLLSSNPADVPVAGTAPLVAQAVGATASPALCLINQPPFDNLKVVPGTAAHLELVPQQTAPSLPERGLSPAPKEVESEPVLEPEPEPPVVHPPFHLTAASKQALQRDLIAQTEGMSIEELVQVRAACFDAIWRSRSQWNREGLVLELMDIVKEMASMAGQTDEEDEQM
ncbi:AAA-domain-containing protein [Tilletiaria anomala UBC 951]|uniref:AAA-domain-containing protein n=1 Tax=Tilletiaria anomala (strain ATCC 24038 / CBS 436.72 / UBC 951) TaxID=1037660 RepID=A0A066WPH5_TILAU|nr:AAA-domain-containing protein [Tilletiaria anomala UBC 951]KDN52879.1 AAA-domain-containing protein [Tilletiaria anomala UBC 951]